MWVFSEIMGLPVEDRRLIIELGDKILGNTDPEVVGEENVAELSLRDPELRKLPFSSPFSLDLMAYGRELGEARRREPHDDITTKLVEAELDGSRLSEQEFGTMFVLLTTAGNETTRHTISLGLLDLLTHPDELRRLVDDPSLAATAADELLRRAHPVHHFRRTATRDVVRARPADQGGRQGPPSGTPPPNYDEGKFADPYRLRRGEGAEPSRDVRPRRSALLPRRAPREARDHGLARGDAPPSCRGSSWPATRCGYARASSTASSACPSGCAGETDQEAMA